MTDKTEHTLDQAAERPNSVSTTKGWLNRRVDQLASDGKRVLYRLHINSGPGSQKGPALTRRDALIIILLFLALVAIYNRGTFHGAHDSRWFIPASMSLLTEGNPDIEEYRHLIPAGDYAVIEHDGRVLNFFPDGVSILIAPLVLAADKTMHVLMGRDLQAELLRVNPWQLELLLASLITSLSAVFVYLTARRFTAWPRSTVLTLIYALGTPAWSTASRGIWQHGPSMLLLSMALYFLLLDSTKPIGVILASVPLSLAYFIRPTNSIAFFVIALYVLVHHRRLFAPFFVAGAMVATFFMLYNVTFYEALLEPYFRPSRIQLGVSMLQVIAANLVSPSRGLLIYSPYLILLPVGLVHRYRQGDLGTLDLCVIVIVYLHLGAISSFPHWWAGESLGPRFWTDMSPLLAYLLLPSVSMVEVGSTVTRSAFTVVFGLLVVIAMLIHGRCALDGTIKEWHTWPVDLDRQPSRVWDWGDIQFLRGIQVMAYQPKSLPLPAYTRWFLPNRSAVTFGQAMTLRGYQLFLEGKHARSPKLVLYWQADGEIDVDYSVFVHLLNEHDEMVTQNDHAPGGRLHYPPTRWESGDLIWDAHELALAEDVPAGTHKLYIGVYDWATGQRLLASGEGELRDDALVIPESISILDHIEAPTFYFPLVYQLHTIGSGSVDAP